MEWSDLVLIARDVADNLAMWIGLASCAILCGAAAAFVSTPEHRNRYQADDEAGDTHTNWGLHRVTAQELSAGRTRTPGEYAPQAAAPRPRVRAGSAVHAAHSAQLRPSYDSRRTEHHQV